MIRFSDAEVEKNYQIGYTILCYMEHGKDYSLDDIHSMVGEDIDIDRV